MGGLCSCCRCICCRLLMKGLLQVTCQILQLRECWRTILLLLLLLLPPSLLALQLLNLIFLKVCDPFRSKSTTSCLCSDVALVQLSNTCLAHLSSLEDNP
jgi:hypothetical protein